MELLRAWAAEPKWGLRLSGGLFARRCFWNLRTVRRRFSLDEFYLAMRMTKLSEFGLQKRVVARDIHEAEMIFEFRIKPNDQKAFLK